jgi:hypothetical protein
MTNKRNELLDRITQLQIERDERQCDTASHHLQLSDEYKRSMDNYSSKLAALYTELRKYPYVPGEN